MKLDNDYEGWVHVIEGTCYCLNEEWDDDLYYCRYIIYNHKENTIKMFYDISKTNHSTFFRDKLDYYDDDYVFNTNPGASSSSLIKIISFEDFYCGINEANRLIICKKIHNSSSTFNIDDLEA
jgi:hypothetical protein